MVTRTGPRRAIRRKQRRSVKNLRSTSKSRSLPSQNMSKVGIGICTYNRLEPLVKLIDMVQSTTKARMVVADDGSQDGTSVFLGARNIEHLTGENLGVAGNKNRLFRMLKDCDFIFILEDDVFIKVRGWVELYLEAHQKTGIHHFLFCPLRKYGNVGQASDINGVHIQHPREDGGVFSFYTKQVIETCGGMDPRFVGYGFEHCDLTERIHRAGLAGSYIRNHLPESERYINFNKLPSVLDKFKKKGFQDHNLSLWMDNRNRGVVKVVL